MIHLGCQKLKQGYVVLNLRSFTYNDVLIIFVVDPSQYYLPLLPKNILFLI